MGNDGFDAKVRPLSGSMEQITPDTEILGGITSVEAFGHTPGHMAYRLDSAGQSLLLAADFANHYVWSLAHPDWEVKFDMDKAQAAATRRRLLDMLAADQMPFIGYHMPWPAVGYVVPMGDGFSYVPESYQLQL
jgi:glyoxylase-like metal-dependent hydrolase (beta-lactamase superfamily II)